MTFKIVRGYFCGVSSNKELTAFLLCGGKGERLRPYTSTLPKPLVPIKDKPILAYILDHLKRFEFQNFVVATGYRAEKIDEFFQNNYKELNVELVNSGDVDIIQRIKDAKKKLTGDFILCYGDTLSNVNLEELVKFHRSHEKEVTVTLWPLRSPFGLLEVDDTGEVTSYQEKPVLDKWINIGYFYFQQEVLDWVDDFETFESFIYFLVEKRKLAGFKHRDIHLTVNTVHELEKAEENIAELER